MAGRRRRQRNTWFPILAGAAAGAQQLPDASFDEYYFSPPLDRTSQVTAIPWIPDTSYDASDLQDGASLRDYVEGNTCVIERIVGKASWSFGQVVPDGDPPERYVQQVVCCTAIAILPVENLPSGQGGPEVPQQEYDPLAAANANKPWMWRRTWVLANNGAQSSVQTTLFTSPGSNEFFASRDDGPHIDTKGTRRAIRRGERLFVIHAVRALDDEAVNSTLVQVVTDLRFLGRMVRAKTKRTF